MPTSPAYVMVFVIAGGVTYAVTPLVPVATSGILDSGAIWLDVNGERKQTGDLARRLVGELRDGKTTFEAAAKKYSGHQQSRLNDGYMGLIRVDELLPAVADAANALKVDGISDPIETADGLHIIKRGQAIESEMLAFDAVEAQVRERLRREAALKIRQAALEKIAAEFPVDTGAGDAESWREALLEAPLTTAPAAASASANE